MIEPKGSRREAFPDLGESDCRTSMRMLPSRRLTATCVQPVAQGTPGAAVYRSGSRRFRARAHGARRLGCDLYARHGRARSPTPRFSNADRDQPEFNEKVWQYLNRRVSDWRITTGKEKAQGARRAARAASRRITASTAAVMLGLWGIESAYGDPDVQKNHMRPVIPALAALAWGEPRRRAYWEQELLNALVIVERGWARRRRCAARGPAPWATPNGCRRCGSISASITITTAAVSPFGKPDDALGSTARYLEQYAERRNQT